MRIESNPFVRTLRAAYLRHDEVKFSMVIGSPGPADDELIADAIRVDADIRRSRDLPVTLSRYLSSVPWLHSSQAALDAAIEAALADLAIKTEGICTMEAAVAALKNAHPMLSGDIERSAMISQLLDSEQIENLATPLPATPEPPRLPFDFGPPDYEGRPRYTLLSLIGAGSQGRVYLAADRVLSDDTHAATVAVKILSVPADNADERSTREALRARRVIHPAIVRVLDRGVAKDNRSYIVYEHIEGQSLDVWTASPQSRPSSREAAKMVIQIASGIQAAHANGVIHLDVKPNNILIARDGQLKLTDFGLAQLYNRSFSPQHTYGSRGSLAFMAPEQFDELESVVGPSSDVYALGGVLYWLLTGRYPNGQSGSEAIAYLHDEAETPHPRLYAEVDPVLATICEQALARAPQNRYASADALIHDLENFISLRPLSGVSYSVPQRSWMLIKRSPAVVGLVALSLLSTGIISSLIVSKKASIDQTKLQYVLDQERLRAKAIDENNDLAASMLKAYLTKVTRSGQLIDSDEWLPTLTVLEWLTGPHLVKLDEERELLWTKRVQIIRTKLRDAEAAGEAGTLENVLWRHTLAFWMMQRDELEAALRHAKKAQTGYEDLGLSANDPMTAQLAEMIAEIKQSGI